MPKDQKEPDIIKIVNNGVVPRLDDLDLARDYNAGRVSERHFRNDTEVPFSYIKDIDFPTMAKFSEHDVGLPGVDIAIKPVRSYVYGALASHHSGLRRRAGRYEQGGREEVTRFTREMWKENRTSRNRWTNIFAGNPAFVICDVTPRVRSTASCAKIRRKQGANVFLTIDARIQAIAEEALRAVSRAGAVVVDPNNGNILAMASVPSFDPNTFIPSIKAKDWKALQKDEGDPLVNRAISGLPPGSTFKLITALAGLRGTKISLAPNTIAVVV